MANPELPIPDGLVLRPFRGVRFAVDNPAEVTSPPYDLIEETSVRELLDSHPNNVVRLILPGADRHRYAEARQILDTWLSSGVLVADETPALYVYEQVGPGVLQRGLIGDVGLAEPEQRVILPHEDVMPGPVADRLALMRVTEANLEPIFLLYEGGGGAATRLVDRIAVSLPPLVETETLDGVRHRLWAVTDPDELASINADLRSRQALIADGHHRYATYLALQREHHATTGAETPRTDTPGSDVAATGSSPTPDTPDTPHTNVSGIGASAAGSRPSSPYTPETDTPRPDTDTPRVGILTANLPATGNSSNPGGSAAKTLNPAASNPAASSPATSGTGVSGTGASGVNADGRSVEPGPWDFGLALLVDSTSYPPNLRAIHRVIPKLPLKEALAKARGAWQVHEHTDLTEGLAALAEVTGPSFLLSDGGRTHLLTEPDPEQLENAMPAHRSARWRAMNTAVLSEFVLPKIWGLRDDEQSVRIVHHDPATAVQLAQESGGTAVLLNPLAVDDVLAIAAQEERVPRKSTSFGPKPRTGLVMRMLTLE
ncbi:DUF1015 family protein [Streptosporangium sp. NPDC051023]|uniref:DUF1015 family protein n=1 Tax=Streptosporangium sp. NPDC051023 TaxID=3155410 RepID=UPI00344F7576